MTTPTLTMSRQGTEVSLLDQQGSGRAHVLCISASNYEGFPFGGTEALVGDLLSTFGSAADLRFTLVGVEEPASEVLRLSAKRVGAVQYPFYPLCTISNPPRGSVRLSFARSILTRRRFLRSLQANLIYAHSWEIARACALAMPDVPIVLHCHGVDNPIRRSRFGLARFLGVPFAYEHLVQRPAIRASRAILVNGDADQFESFLSKHRKGMTSQCVRIPAVVDRSVFHRRDQQECRRALGIDGGRTVLVFAGRLEAPKGVDLVLRAFAQLHAKDPNVLLIVVGDGGQRPRLERLAAGLTSTEAVSFVGHVPRDAVASYFGAADAFVSGSEREAISMALLEALASGLPAVVTDSGGAGELISNGWNGFVLPDRRPELMAARLSEALAWGQQVRERSLEVAARYDAQTIGQSVLAKLRESLGPSAGLREVPHVPVQDHPLRSGPMGVRVALRWALRTYLRWAPLEYGKGRMLRVLGPAAAGTRVLVRSGYAGDMEIELDIGEYIQSSIFYRGYYEPEVVRAIRSLLHKGQDAIDVGANIGCFTLIMADAVGPVGRVHAFEADPRLVDRLSRNTRLNRLENVVSNQMAVSNTSGLAQFYASAEADNWGLGSLQPLGANAVGISCRKITLDEYFRSHHPARLDRVGLIKMDIEGGEWPALLGASELVALRPALILEMCDLLTSRFGYSSKDFLGWLRSMGYECYRLTRSKLRPMGREVGRQGAEVVCFDAKAAIPCI